MKRPGPQRRTRAEQQAATRQALLRAAGEEFTALGFAGASIERISAAAGFTRGAFYANFDSKDEVFLALVEDRMARSAAELRAIFEADTTTERRLASFQERYETGPADGIDWAILDAEFWLYAQRNPAARQQLAALQHSLRAELAALITDQLELAGVSPPLPSDELAAAAMALDEGLVHQRRTDPTAIAPDLLMRTLSLFLTDSPPGSEA